MKRSTTIVVAGHLCLDVIPTIGPRAGGIADILVPGSLLNVGAAVVSTGGVVSNTGLALHRLGAEVRLMGKTGDDPFGQTVRAIIAARAPALVEGMILSPGESTSYSVVLNIPGIDRIFLHYRGTNDSFNASDIDEAALEGIAVFHFGYPPLMARMFAGDGNELVKVLAKARAAGASVSLDLAYVDPASEAGRANWPLILKNALPLVDIFAPSIEEIGAMLRPGVSIETMLSLPFIDELAGELLNYGPGIVVIKLGDRGLFLRTAADAERWKTMGAGFRSTAAAWAGRRLLLSCLTAKVVGATGAGDCAVAGFLAAFVRGLTPFECARFAVASGSANVEEADAISGIPDWDTLRRRIDSGWAYDGLKLDIPPDWTCDEGRAMAWKGIL